MVWGPPGISITASQSKQARESKADPYLPSEGGWKVQEGGREGGKVGGVVSGFLLGPDRIRAEEEEEEEKGGIQARGGGREGEKWAGIEGHGHTEVQSLCLLPFP